MPSSLSAARRNAFGNNYGPIDGRVQRKTMMGGASQGPISRRPTRSEAMEMEAEAALDVERQKGIARARAEQRTVSAPVGESAKPKGIERARDEARSVNAPVTGSAKQKGQLIPGHSPGSSMWVKDGDPRLAKPMDKSAVPSRSATPNVKPATGQDGAKRVDDLIRKALPPAMKPKPKSGGMINGRPADMVLAEARRRQFRLRPPSGIAGARG